MQKFLNYRKGDCGGMLVEIVLEQVLGTVPEQRHFGLVLEYFFVPETDNAKHFR